jgi:hypothetical protein
MDDVQSRGEFDGNGRLFMIRALEGIPHVGAQHKIESVFVNMNDESSRGDFSW